MKRVIDTNVAIIANGRGNDRNPSPSCRIAAIKHIQRIIKSGVIVLDDSHFVQEEYRRHLKPRGQPGVGDQFYRIVLQSHPDRIRRISLPMNPDGSFADFPCDPALNRFDLSDRKFVALARRSRTKVSVCTDSDWVDFRLPLEANGVAIDFLCGEDRVEWFES